MHTQHDANELHNKLRCDYTPLDTECPAIGEVVRSIDQLIQAFPAGGYAGLRLYHEELIATMKARREFWQKLTFELAKFGLVGFIGWAFYKKEYVHKVTPKVLWIPPLIEVKEYK